MHGTCLPWERFLLVQGTGCFQISQFCHFLQSFYIWEFLLNYYWLRFEGLAVLHAVLASMFWNTAIKPLSNGVWLRIERALLEETSPLLYWSLMTYWDLKKNVLSKSIAASPSNSQLMKCAIPGSLDLWTLRKIYLCMECADWSTYPLLLLGKQWKATILPHA